MKSILLSIVICGFFFCSCAQSSHTIKRAAAYYTTTIPGRSMKDDNGNIVNPKPIIGRTLYIESKDKPVLETVLYNGIAFISSVSSRDSTEVKVGITMSGNPVLLKPQRGNSIWKVDLIQKDEKDKTPEQVTNIFLKGKVGKYTFTYKLNKETELNTPDMY